MAMAGSDPPSGDRFGLGVCTPQCAVETLRLDFGRRLLVDGGVVALGSTPSRKRFPFHDFTKTNIRLKRLAVGVMWH